MRDDIQGGVLATLIAAPLMIVCCGGGGINMEFYDPARVTSFTGLDPSPELLAMSRAAAAARGMDATIEGGVGEAMPFGSGRFDTVVTTFTLCSVADQAAVLAEIRRVLGDKRVGIREIHMAVAKRVFAKIVLMIVFRFIIFFLQKCYASL